MLKDLEINDILSNFSKITNKRKVIKIMDSGNFYLLLTKDPSDENNFDPFYLYYKNNKNIVHASIIPTPKFIKILGTAKKNVVWEDKEE